MAETYVQARLPEQPIFREGPVPEPPLIEPDEAQIVQEALLSLPSWQALQFDSPVAFIDLAQPNYARLFNGGRWEFVGNQRLTARTRENYPAVVIRSGTFLEDRPNIINMLQQVNEIIGEGKVYVLEKGDEKDPLRDTQERKRKDILTSSGFSKPQIHFLPLVTAWEAKKEEAPQEVEKRLLMKREPVPEVRCTNCNSEVQRSELLGGQYPEKEDNPATPLYKFTVEYECTNTECGSIEGTSTRPITSGQLIEMYDGYDFSQTPTTLGDQEYDENVIVFQQDEKEDTTTKDELDEPKRIKPPTTLDEAIHVAAGHPNRVIPTTLRCFDCARRGQKGYLSGYAEYVPKEGGGESKFYLQCPADGVRLTRNL